MHIVEELLRSQPKFRERKHKNYGIAYLLKKKYNLDIETKLLEDIIVEGSTFDREWRKSLQDYEDLRGTDYDSKKLLEQEKMISLGYEPHYHNDIKYA